uniref:Uncharacterized protein n=1 Tax=Maylandia zebra TaxID=106582 RepID=A0A3P9B9V2_9CICH
MKSKDINDLREAIVAPHQSGKGYKVISKQSEIDHSVIYKWKTPKTYTKLSGGPSKFTPGSDRLMLREIATNNRTLTDTTLS